MFKRSAVALTLTFCIATTVLGHEGKVHIMGIVTAFDANQVTVKTPDGKTATIGIKKDTRYLRGETATSASELRVGQRIVVDVSGQGQKATASEIRLGVQETKRGMKHNIH